MNEITAPLTVKIVGSDMGDSPEVPINTLNDASAKYRAFIEENGLGASGAGRCLIMQSGKVVGRVSYNGKVWEGNTHTPNATPIFQP